MTETLTRQMPAKPNPFAVAQQQFNLAADYLHLDSGTRALLGDCTRELTVRFPVRMDDGTVHAFTGYRVQHSVPPVVTGKPLSIGGSEGRAEATGRGVMIVTLEALRRLKIDPSAASVVVQGYGNVGSNAARSLAAQGCRVVGVSDQYGGIHNSR